jgi:hypothetical protein
LERGLIQRLFANLKNQSISAICGHFQASQPLAIPHFRALREFRGFLFGILSKHTKTLLKHAAPEGENSFQLGLHEKHMADRTKWPER